jgi:hypothetical protein
MSMQELLVPDILRRGGSPLHNFFIHLEGAVSFSIWKGGSLCFLPLQAVTLLFREEDYELHSASKTIKLNLDE